MANPLEAWKQHAMASEQMDIMGVGSHQKKGWNFAENFPSLVPGSGVTATQWVGPALATGYQLGQEGLRSILPEKWGGTGIGFTDAMKKGWTEAKQNIEGMSGKGFDKNEYDEWMHAQGYAPDYDFSDIEGQTAMLDPFSLLTLGSKILGPTYALKSGGINELAKYKIRKDITDKGWAKTKEILAAKAAAEAKAKADAAAAVRRQQQQKTIAARGTAQGSGGTFVDRKTGAMKGYEKGAGGGKDAPSQHFYIARGGLAQRAPRYANGGLINFYRYGGFV